MLDLLVENLRDVLQDTRAPRDGEWAFYRCKETLEIHEAVYNEMLPAAYVMEEVIPVLRQAYAAVDKAAPTGLYGNKIEGFAENISIRIQDLSEYVQGPLSRLKPV